MKYAVTFPGDARIFGPFDALADAVDWNERMGATGNIRRMSDPDDQAP